MITKHVTLCDSDAYKLSHKGFMNDKTEYIYSNMTPRSFKYLPVLKEFFDNKAIFFGMQYFIKNYLIDEWNHNFFGRPKKEVIAKFKRRTDTFLGKDSVSMEHFEILHDLGYLPISIKALPEGAAVNVKVPFFTIINTDPRFAWLTNYLETIISCETWKPSTTATIALGFRKMVAKFAMETTGSIAGIEFNCHGFEFRGMSGRHDAAISGAGHLLSFWGTDTIPAIDLLEDYYNADAEKELIAASVPASEHSISSLGTSLIGELEFFRKAITKDYPTGIVSLVSDTYDFFRVVTKYATILKDDILNRKPNAIGLCKVVFRPDSGDPVKIVCGDPDALADSPEYKGEVECLWDVFGGTVSTKGYKVLHEKVSIIYGDSITQQRAFDIFTRLKNKGFASVNVLCGVGSYSYGYLSRDSMAQAIKATWAQVDSIGYEIYKTPKTDDGIKNSAKGLLRVDKIDDNYVLTDCVSKAQESGGELKEIFRDGKLLIEHSLKDIRARINENVNQFLIKQGF
jgi:nicotinamide phosphoribosyltransferase